MSDSAKTEVWRRRRTVLLGLLSAAVCLLFPIAQAGGAEPDERRVHIESIVLEGLARTKPFVVRRELLVDEGQDASVERIEESVQRVRNTGLFRKVRYRLDESSADDTASGAEPVVLHIAIDEKWTTLPIFSFARGGGTYRLIAGGFDDNFLGRYIGVGGQYERLGEANSFYGWLDHPRLFGQRLRGRIDAGTRNRVYRLFDDAGEVDGGFLRQRFTVGASLQKEWLWWLRTQASVRWQSDDFSLDLLSSPVEQRQRERGLPEPGHALLGSVSVMLGRIDQDNYLLDGTRLDVTLEHANRSVGSSHTRTKFLAGVSHFEDLSWNSNLGARVAVGFGQVETIHDRFYLGGLDAIRGFPSDRFSGEHYWLANLEYRIPSVDTRWLVLQHVFFVDAAGASEEISQIAGLSGASAGIGLRFIVPKIQGFIGRIDYAFALSGSTTNPLSLGGGQFF